MPVALRLRRRVAVRPPREVGPNRILGRAVRYESCLSDGDRRVLPNRHYCSGRGRGRGGRSASCSFPHSGDHRQGEPRRPGAGGRGARSLPLPPVAGGFASPESARLNAAFASDIEPTRRFPLSSPHEFNPAENAAHREASKTAVCGPTVAGSPVLPFREGLRALRGSSDVSVALAQQWDITAGVDHETPTSASRRMGIGGSRGFSENSRDHSSRRSISG